MFTHNGTLGSNETIYTPIVETWVDYYSADSITLSADQWQLDLDNLYGDLTAPFNGLFSLWKNSYLSDCPNLCSL